MGRINDPDGSSIHILAAFEDAIGDEKSIGFSLAVCCLTDLKSTASRFRVTNEIFEEGVRDREILNV